MLYILNIFLKELPIPSTLSSLDEINRQEMHMLLVTTTYVTLVT